MVHTKEYILLVFTGLCFFYSANRVFAGTAIGQASVSHPVYGIVNGNNVNVRATPNTSYAAIGRINPGERAPLIVTSKFNINWYHIVWPMQTGYISDTASVAYIY